MFGFKKEIILFYGGISIRLLSFWLRRRKKGEKISTELLCALNNFADEIANPLNGWYGYCESYVKFYANYIIISSYCYNYPKLQEYRIIYWDVYGLIYDMPIYSRQYTYYMYVCTYL